MFSIEDASQVLCSEGIELIASVVDIYFLRV